MNELDMKQIGNQIAALRKAKGLTQAQLGERLGISFQAISNWENGKTLPDVAVLLDLAHVLETSVDNILTGGQKMIHYRGKITVSDMREGILCLERLGKLLGKDNAIYCHAIHGINEGMNTDIEAAFNDDYLFECFVAEAIIQNLMAGSYIDLTDVQNQFKYDRFKQIITDYAARYNIR